MTPESLNFWLTKFIMEVFVNVNFGIKKLKCIKVVLLVIPVYSGGIILFHFLIAVL